MKKILLSVALVLSSTCISVAQHATGSLTIQPKVGFNISTMTNSDGADPRIGLNAGAEFEYQVNNPASLSFGILYTQQGVKGTGDGFDASLKLDYIAVPVLANFYIAKGLAIKVGLQPEFRINSKVKAVTNGISTEMDLKKFFDVNGLTSKINSFYLSAPVGISYEINNVVLDARYNFGITNAISVENENSRNNYFQFTLGYKFELK